MCSIDSHEKNNLSEHDDEISGGGYPIPLNSTKEALVSLSTTIYFIGCWLQDLEHSLIERCNMYFFAIKNMFQKIPVELPQPDSPKKRHQSLLHDIEGSCYMNKLSEKIPPLKKSKLSKKVQKRSIK